MNVDLAILLVTSAAGAALLLFTTGRAGGYLVQPRSMKGVPVGPSATPNPPGDPAPAQPEKVPIPGNPNPPNDWPVPPKPGNGGDDQPQGPPPCKYNLLVLALLEQYAVELSPYATGRAKAPWPDVTGSAWKVGLDELFAQRNEGPGYYITAAVLKTLLAQGLDPNDFAQSPGKADGFVFPGCILPDAAFANGTPLRNLVSAWQAGSDEPLPGDANIDAEDN